MPPADGPDAPAASGTGEHVYLIDGSGFIFRAFFALPPMNRPDGTPTNAVYGFAQMVLKLVEETDADHVAVIFDAARENFRNDIYPDYKGHRPDAPEELVPQFPLIREATEAFSVPAVEMEGYEADDLIATYARQARERGAAVTIVSSDKDLMQLVREGVTMLDPIKNREITPEDVREKFGVDPDRVVDVQALAGDSTDNVPGVPGIGVKTAAQLIGEYGDLENLLAHAEEIKQPKRRQALTENAEMARISRQLVLLKDDVEVTVPLADLKRREPDREKLLAFFKENAFKRLIARIEGEMADEAGASAEPAPPAPTESAYSLVQDRATLERWVAAATVAGHVAVDTETTSLHPMQARLVGVSLAVTPGEACYIPLGHRDPSESDLFADKAGTGGTDGVPEQIPLDEAIAILKPMLEDPAVLKIGQNLKYDLSVLHRHGIAVQPIDDTMLLSFVTEGGLHGHGMDELAGLHLDHTPTSYEEVAGKGSAQVTFDLVPLAAARDYAAEDADVTLRLWRALKPTLLEKRLVTLYETIERPLVPVLAAMERAGIRVDPQVLGGMSRDFARRLTDLEGEIHELAGAEFNVGSPKQLGEVLFDRLGLQGGRKTKTGAYSTDSATLEPLADDNPIVRKVLDWRMLAKLKSTYTDALIEDVDPGTGRVHTSYMMTGAQTGRLSSTDPNLQNIPIRTEEGRKIRTAFVAPEGSVLISLDYSQIELRIVAHMAEIDALREAFAEGRDIHAATAAEVFGVPLDEMTPETRRKAKAINFGIIYGISPYGLGRQIGVPTGEAKTYIDTYFERFPGIRAYMDETVSACRKAGYVETLYGRRIHIPEINAKSPQQRGYAERQAINAPVQGSAADIIKRAMVRVPPLLETEALAGTKMLLQVHDELIFEAPEDKAEAVIEQVGAVMANAAGPARELAVPLVVDSGTGKSWAEAH